MGEQIYHGAQACSGTNLRRCQDLGDSILLILGSFILLNVGINVVTLLWRHLKSSLRILFHHFFPKDKQPIGLNSRPMCMRCTTDPKNLCSRISSRIHRHPSFLLGRVKHLDSWIPDTNDENVSRCCWMPPQCRHARTPTEAPWELWKEGIMGAGEAPQATAMKAQVPLFFSPEISPQFPKTNKLDIVPPSLPQETKTKVPDDDPAHTHEHLPTKSQTHTSEHTPFQAQGLEHTLTYTPSACVPDLISAPTPTHNKAPTPASTLPPIPSHNQISTPPCAPAHSQVHALVQAKPQPSAPIQVQISAPTPFQGSIHSSEHSHSQVHSPEQTLASTPPQPPNQAPEYASSQSQGHEPVQTPAHTLTHSQDISEQTPSQPSAHTPAHSLFNSCAHTPVLGPTSAPVPYPTFVPAAPIPVPVCAPTPALALSMTMTATSAPAQVPAANPTPILSSVPSAPAAFGSSFSTGHVISDTFSIKKNIFLKYNGQKSRYYRKDLSNLSGPQEGQGLGNSGTSAQTLKQHSGDSDEPPAGSILGYLELGNMEWKISDNAKDKFSQPKTFPYCSFHPCCSERKNTEFQAPVYPKFLMYTQDATASKPCFHSPSNAQSPLSTIPPPCTLSLPLVSPRTFVLPQSNHQKSFNLMQTPTFLPASKFPQTVSPSHCSRPPPFSTISQPLIQPQQPQSQDLKQEFDLQKTSSLAKESRVSRNPDLTQDPSLHKNPGLIQNLGLNKNPDLTQNPGLHKNPDLTQDPSLHKNPGLTQNSGLHMNPVLTQNPGLHKNSGLTQNSGLHRNLGLTQNPSLHRNPDLTSNLGLPKNPGFTPNPGLHKNPCFHKFPSLTQDYASRGPVATQDAGVLRSSGFTHTYPQKNILFTETSEQGNSGFLQDSGIYRNIELNQDTAAYKSQDLSPTCDQKRPAPSQDSRGNNTTGNVQDSGICNPALTQDSRPQKSQCHSQDTEVNRSSELTRKSTPHNSLSLEQASCLHKNSHLMKDSGDYKNLSLAQDSEIYRVPDLTQESDSKSLILTHAPQAEKRLNLTQDVGIFRGSEHTQNPNLYKFPRINQDPGLQQGPTLAQGSGFPKTPDLTQQAGFQKDSCLIPDPGLNKNPGLPPATDSAQALGPLTALKLTSSPMKSSVCKMVTQKENAKQHVSWTSAPINQNTYLPKAQVLSSDLQNLSEVPVLIELQPSSQQSGSQDWVYCPIDRVSLPCQNYRQMSMPPKINWQSHCPGPGSTRTGHVIFDPRQKILIPGRDKCEALFPRRPRQETPSNSGETLKEWGYQNVMRTLDKEGANTRQE